MVVENARRVWRKVALFVRYGRQYLQWSWVEAVYLQEGARGPQ